MLFFSLQVIHKTKSKRQLFSACQPCSFDSCSPSVRTLNENVNKGAGSNWHAWKKFFSFSSWFKEKTNPKRKHTFKSGKQKLSNFVLFWCYQCAILLLLVTIVTCCLWFCFEGLAHVIFSLLIRLLLILQGVAVFAFVLVGLLLFRTFANFSVKLPICGWIFFRVLFRVVLIMQLFVIASKKGGEPSVWFSVVKS